MNQQTEECSIGTTFIGISVQMAIQLSWGCGSLSVQVCIKEGIKLWWGTMHLSPENPRWIATEC